jgi:transposase
MSKGQKSSLREEVLSYEKKYEVLGSSGQISPEVAALVTGLLTLMKMMLVIFMEKNTRKSSRNSSIPPSQTDTDATTSTDDPARNSTTSSSVENLSGNTSNFSEDIHILEHAVLECSKCGKDLENEPIKGHERRTLIDIEYRKVIYHEDAHIKQCPSCGRESKGQFSPEFHGPKQYGTGLQAFIVHLLTFQLVPLKRVIMSLQAMYRITLSPATLISYVLKMYTNLELWEQEAIAFIKKQTCVCCDETSLKVTPKKWWVHVYTSGGVTVKLLHQSRGLTAMKELGILAELVNFIVHDRYSSYFTFEKCGHALCGSHILRDLEFIIESNNYRWARNMKRLLKTAAAMVTKSKKKKLTTKEFNRLRSNYRNILTRGANELPPIPARSNGKRGKIAKSEAHNLHDAMTKYEDAILMFAKESLVPFTNNDAERAIRMTKVKQKISGCFRTELLARAYCRITSYIQTTTAMGINPMLAIQMALNGRPIMPENQKFSYK